MWNLEYNGVVGFKVKIGDDKQGHDAARYGSS